MRAALVASRRGLNGRPRAYSGRQGLKARLPVFPPSNDPVRAFLGARRAPRRMQTERMERQQMALYEHIFLARQDVTAAAGRSADGTDQVENRLARRRGHQGRALGAEVAGVPHQEEPQGAFHSAQHRCAVRGGRRARAHLEHQRRRDSLPHHPRRRARDRPFGDAAQARRRRPRRARPARAARRPPRSRRSTRPRRPSSAPPAR